MLLKFLKVFVITLMIFFWPFPVVYIAKTAPAPVPHFMPVTYEDYPVCSGNCFDVWESEGNFGKPW